METITRTDLFFTFNINNEGGNNFIGSGQLDGNGIPVNFFSDPNVRKGFAYCFNYDTYLNDVMLGEGVRSNNVMLPGMIGYQEDSPIYTYDPAKCTELLQASKWTKTGDTYTPDPAGDISLWDTGFRFTATYNTGNTARQTVGQILQAELGAINENFIVEVTGLPWPTFLKNQRAQKLPIFFSGWQEDIHDPHNWVVPFTIGTYGGRQKMPAEIKDQFEEIIDRARSRDRSCQARRDLRGIQPALLRYGVLDPAVRAHRPPLPAALGAGLVQQPDLPRHLLLPDF